MCTPLTVASSSSLRCCPLQASFHSASHVFYEHNNAQYTLRLLLGVVAVLVLLKWLGLWSLLLLLIPAKLAWDRRA